GVSYRWTWLYPHPAGPSRASPLRHGSGMTSVIGAPCATSSAAGAVGGAGEHGVGHRLGQPAGEGVLLRGVVAAEQGDVGRPVGSGGDALGTVPARRRRRYVVPPAAQGPDPGVPAERT